MKKRLLLILAIGISFAPAVFAAGLGGSAVGAFTRSDKAGQSFCQAGITRTKDDSSAVSTNDDQGSSKSSSQAGSISD